MWFSKEGVFRCQVGSIVEREERILPLLITGKVSSLSGTAEGEGKGGHLTEGKKRTKNVKEYNGRCRGEGGSRGTCGGVWLGKEKRRGKGDGCRPVPGHEHRKEEGLHGLKKLRSVSREGVPHSQAHGGGTGRLMTPGYTEVSKKGRHKRRRTSGGHA